MQEQLFFSQNFNPRPYQVAAHAAAWKAITVDKEDVIIESATGTGKSVMIAHLVKAYRNAYPESRILVITHTVILIEQDREKCLSLVDEPLGVCSGSVKKYELNYNIIFSTVGTIHRRLELLKKFDLVIIDEPQLIPEKETSMYRETIAKLRRDNNAVRIVGYTATPYRTEGGMLDSGKKPIFKKIAFVYSMAQAIEEGYLSRIVTPNFPLPSPSSLDEADFIRKEMGNIIRHGMSRRSWLIFASSIRECYGVRDELNKSNIRAECITSKTSRKKREEIIKEFKAGKIKAIVNMGVLTTGFDVGSIDFIILFRLVRSPPLLVQIIGRGTRLAEGKKNCLIFDYSQSLKKVFLSFDNINQAIEHRRATIKHQKSLFFKRRLRRY